MRTLFWWLRSCFCKHDWEYEEIRCSVYRVDQISESDVLRVSMTCKKCGWHRNYNKF